MKMNVQAKCNEKTNQFDEIAMRSIVQCYGKSNESAEFRAILCWQIDRVCDKLALMDEAAAIARMTSAEYLEWERQQLDKHEFHHGEVFAMAGGSPEHNFLAGKMNAALQVALHGKRCAVFPSDQRISLQNNERYVYPDTVVVCGGIRREPGSPDVITNPSIIVEVLSPSTESYDRGMKWEAYQKIDTVTDYLLVSQSGVRIEHFQREANGSWNYRAYQSGDTITLSNGASLNVDAIYEGAFDLEAG